MSTEARKLRVLLVTPDFPPEKGGIQILLGRIVENAPGLDVRVLALGYEGDAEFDRDLGAEVRRVANSAMSRPLAVLGLNARSLAEAARFRPDAILSGHVVASIGALAVRRALRIPLVQYVHADEFRVRAGLTGRVVRAADTTIAVSRYTREMTLAAGAAAERIRVILPGVDLPDAFRIERGSPPTLLTVATMLFRYKGHDTMARAMPLIRAKVPGARWVVVGDGPFRPAVESAVTAYRIGDAVNLLGRVSDEERNRWLDRANVFCMPSRVPAAGVGGEGFGSAYQEAGARGMPAIGGNVAGARDAVANGETGLLVNPADHLAVAGAAVELLADPKRAEEMGAAARRRAEGNSWPKVAARVEEVLREAAGRRKAA
ncbi:MAG: glycosyltransferase family 4 protein [Solirubrobacterales bacterium]